MLPRLKPPKLNLRHRRSSRPRSMPEDGRAALPRQGDDHVAGRPRRHGCEVWAAAEASSGKRRFGAMAAVVALATVAGALGGALATAGVGKLMAGDSASASAKDSTKDSTLEATVARIDADIVALKASLEQTAKTGATQFNKASDRLDKVEKAQGSQPRNSPNSAIRSPSSAKPPTSSAPRRRRLKLRQRMSASPARYRSRSQPLRLRPHLRLRPSLKSPGCRRSKAGSCATSPTAAR